MKLRSSSSGVRQFSRGRGGTTSRTAGTIRAGLAACTIVAIAGMTLFTGPARAAGSGWTRVASTHSYHLSGAAVTGKDGTVYVFGGRIPNSPKAVGASESYTPGSKTWAPVAPMPTARWGLAAVLGPGGKIYVFGGHGKGGVRRKNEVYDPKANTWTAKAPMPIGRLGIAAAPGADGRIYVFGGFRRSYGADGEGDLNTVQIYDPATNTWTVNHSMPAPLQESSAVLGSNGKIYLMGGRPAESIHAVSRVSSYDPSSRRWTQVAPMSVVRTSFAAVSGPDGRIYAIAGQNSESTLRSVEAYSIGSNTWKNVASLPSDRYQLSAVVSGGSIYEIGGADAAGAATKSVMSYIP